MIVFLFLEPPLVFVFVRVLLAEGAELLAFSAAAAARAARAAAASDAAWRTLFDAREAAKTALAEKESK